MICLCTAQNTLNYYDYNQLFGFYMLFIIVLPKRKHFEIEEKDMKPRSEKSMELYEVLLERGYPHEFCDAITKNLNTDFTAKRMLGYLGHYKKLPTDEIVDEMLAILSDRNRIMQKKEMENTNALWNQYMLQGFHDEDE